VASSFVVFNISVVSFHSVPFFLGDNWPKLNVSVFINLGDRPF